MPEGAAPPSALGAILGEGGALVLAPHPDDESLGCGALIAAALAAGRPVEVVLLTLGERSHPGSAAWPPERLARLRRAEIETALGLLGGGAEHLHCLAYPDCGVPAGGPEAERAARAVAARLDRLGPATLIAPAEADPHCDHKAAARIARAAAALRPGTRLLSYPIWSRRRDAAREAGILRLPLGVHAAAKRRAVEAHRSQRDLVVGDDPAGFVLPADFIEMFLGEPEIFREAPDADRHA